MAIRPSRVALVILYAFVAAALAFVFLEAGVRYFRLAPRLISQVGYSVPDPYIPYRPRPLARVSFVPRSGEYESEHAHNSLGFRDVEHSTEKPPGVFRILGLGDSFTYGQGAAFEETYLYRLETMLNGRPGNHPRIEIIKAGIYRFWTEPQRILLQQYGLRFQPDLVIVGFVPNDVMDTFFGMDFVKVGPDGYLKSAEASQLGGTGTFLYLRCHSCRIVLHRYVAYRISRKYPVRWREIYRAGGRYENEWTRVEREFSIMADLVRGAGAKLVVVHIPQPGPPRRLVDYHSYPARRLSSWAARRGIEFIDTLPALRSANSQRVVYWKEDDHPNPEGYRIIAETIFAELSRRKLVP